MALVYDPRTGRFVDDGQPTPSPLAAVGGAAARATAPLVDSARVGVVNLLGGDPDTLPGGPNAATNAAAALPRFQIGDTLSGMAYNARASALDLFGVKPPAPAVAGVVTPAAAPPAAPAVTEAAAAAAEPPATPLLGGDQLAAINAQIAQSLEASRPQGGLMPAERGSYNQTNTARAAVSSDNGINFGFGVGGAPTAEQYLAQMQVADQQQRRTAQADAAQRDFKYAQNAVATARTREEVLRARALMDAAAPMAKQAQEEQAASALAAQMGFGEQNLAARNVEAELLRAQIAGQSTTAAAELTGQYGLMGRQATADATLAAAQAKNTGPQARASNARAQLDEVQLQLAAEAYAAGDFDKAAAIISGRGAPNQRIALDMLNNPIGTYDAAGKVILYSDQELAELRRASGLAQGR